jgi:6-phosphogluconolactonase (cycloisomerase 2 family)
MQSYRSRGWDDAEANYGVCYVMISKAQFLRRSLLIAVSTAMVGCTPVVPCNIVGDGRNVFGGPKRAATSICGKGGGGGGTTCSSTLMPNEVMLSVDNKGNVLEFGIDSTTGALTLMCNTATAAVGPLAVSNNNFLYVLDTSTTPAQVFGFVIAHGKSGVLAAITGSPFKLSEQITGNATMVADPLGRFLFVTNNAGNDVHVLTITAGALAEAATSPTTVSTPDHIAITTAGDFAFVPDSFDGNIFTFSLDVNGKLTQTLTSPFIIPNLLDRAHFAIVHPTAKLLFTADTESVSSFVFDTSGNLTPAGGSPFQTGGSQVEPLLLALDMSGKFLYVTPVGTAGLNGDTSINILGYQIDTVGGGLTVTPNSPTIPPSTTTSTLDVIGNPIGQEMYVFSDTTVPSVVVFVAPIDAQGNLTIPTTSLTVLADEPPVFASIQ